MKLKASLEAVKTRKNVTDDIIQTATFTVYGEPVEIAKLNAYYRLPLELTLEVLEKKAE